MPWIEVEGEGDTGLGFDVLGLGEVIGYGFRVYGSGFKFSRV
jgi:hypothetical protein